MKSIKSRVNKMPTNIYDAQVEKADRLYESEIATWLWIQGEADTEELDEILFADVILWNDAFKTLR